MIDRNPKREHLKSLKSKLSIIAEAIPPASQCLYLDIAMHRNVGDLLMVEGALSFAKDNGLTITHWSSVHDNGRFLPNVGPEHTILLNGGGNLGDLWPRHEAYRQMVLSRYPANRIIVLPQTIYFRSQDAAQQCAAAYRTHPSCTIFVRDAESKRFAGAVMGLHTVLVPDIAHQLLDSELLTTNPTSGEGSLLLRRTDRESNLAEIPDHALDWDQILRASTLWTHLALRLSIRLNRAAILHEPLMQFGIRTQRRMIKEAVRYFQPYRIIDTDRLHAMLLALLLGKEVVAHDNTYGKLFRYSDTWLQDIMRSQANRTQTTITSNLKRRR